MTLRELVEACRTGSDPACWALAQAMIADPNALAVHDAMTASDALIVVNGTLGSDLVPTRRGDELKGWVRGPDGTSKFYLDAADCRRLARAFLSLADTLAAPGTEET